MKTNELVQWMDNAQTKIGQVLGMENISAQVTAVIQSPIVITYKLQLITPVHGQVNRMLLLSETLEQNLGISPIRVYPQDGVFHIELPSPVPVTPYADILAEYTRGSTICVGFDTSAEPVYIPLHRFPNVLWVAPPGAGKTSSARSIVYAVLKNNNAVEEKVSILICAEKLDAWRAFVGLRGIVDVVSDFDDMSMMLKTVSSSLSKKAKSGEKFTPPVIIVVDDLLRVLSQKPEIGKFLGEIGSVGRSVGAYMFVITQSSGSKAGTGGIQVEDNIAARIIYRTTSKTSAARSTGEDASGVSDLTTTPGDALLVVGSTKMRIATGFVDDEDVVKLPISENESRFMRDLLLAVPDTVALDELHIEQKLQVSATAPEKVSFVENVAQPLTIKRISPPRELNLGEMRHLRLIMQHYANNGNPLSKNKLMEMLFGGKNGAYNKYLQNALNQIAVWDGNNASTISYT